MNSLEDEALALVLAAKPESSCHEMHRECLVVVHAS
jgi:hypothetical protein